jgi:alpha-glucosidase
MLTFYRRLLALRRSEPALVEGAIERVASSGNVLTYERRLGGDWFFIALNMAAADASVEVPQGTLVLSTTDGHEGKRIAGSRLLLAGDEGIVIRASKPA